MFAATRHIPLQHAQALLMIVLSAWVLPGAIRAQTLENPPQEGVVADVPSLDDLVGKRWSSWAFIRQFRLTDDLSIPLADIITLEVGRPDIGRTVLLGLGLVAGFVFTFTLNWK